MKFHQFFFWSILILLSFLLCIEDVAGQAGRGKGRINGVILDEQGNPVLGAKVVIQYSQDQTVQREISTDKKGQWAFLGLGSGIWKITASAEGYIPTTTATNVSQLGINPKITLTLKKMAQSQSSFIRDQESLNFIEKANQLFSEKKYDEAISLMQQFLEKNPKAYQAYINIGDCYREKGEFEKAIENYNWAIEEAKKDETTGKEMTAKALAAIGECHMRKGDFSSAQTFFKQSIDTYPENEALAYNVGEIFFSNQKHDEAIQYFTLATKIKPDWGPAYYKLGLVYLNKADYEKAIENLKKFLELEPNSEFAPTVKNMLEYLEKIKK
ncbi:MAG: tetratricopeptide repeat protein [Acidobacteriota bacterium]